MYRLVDFYRKKFDVPGTVERIEYDPNRSCYIMLIKFEDGTHFYYLAPQKISVGDVVENGSAKEIKVGNCMPLRDIPVGVNVHNVELQPGGGGKIARSAGTVSYKHSRAYETREDLVCGLLLEKKNNSGNHHCNIVH